MSARKRKFGSPEHVQASQAKTDAARKTLAFVFSDIEEDCAEIDRVARALAREVLEGTSSADDDYEMAPDLLEPIAKMWRAALRIRRNAARNRIVGTVAT